MCKQEFKLEISNDKDKEALNKMIRLILHFITYNSKDGVGILNLIAKNDHENLLKDYFISMHEPKIRGIFHNAVEDNCLELIKFMINENIVEKSYRFKEWIDIAKRLRYSEMLEVLEKFNNT